MALTDEQINQIAKATAQAHREGKPLFKPKPKPKPKPEFSEAQIFAQMKRMGGTLR